MKAPMQNTQDFQDFVVERLYSTMTLKTANCSDCSHYKSNKCVKQKYNNLASFHGIETCWQLCTFREKIALFLVSKVCIIN